MTLYLRDSAKILGTTAQTGGTSYNDNYSSGFRTWTGTNVISGDISGTSYTFHIYAASVGNTSFRADLKINDSLVATFSFTASTTTYSPYGGIVTGTDPSLSGYSTVTLEIHHTGGNMGGILWGDFGADDSYVVLPGPSSNPTISGTITHNGSPLAGVVMSGLPGNPTTNSSGFYTATVESGWSGTATPTLSGYSFTPASRSYSSVTSNQSAQNYTAALLTYTISGTITSGGSPLAGVVMSGLPGNPTTNGSGFYTATVNHGWSGTATPTLSGYTFTPASRSYSSVTSNQTAQDYSAAEIPASITVTSPNGGENWPAGSSRNITWTSSGTSGTVRIEYSTDNGTGWTDVIASTPDDGSYGWTVPNNPSVECLVRISDTDGVPSDQSDGVFSISTTAGIYVKWNTFLGHRYGWAITVDGSGNVYVGGHASYGWGTPVNAHSGNYDGFVAKLDSGGNVIWHTYLGSPNQDVVNGIVLDDAGNIYVTGYSRSTWGTPINPHTGMADTFVAKLNNNGNLLWHTFWGSSSDDWNYSIALDKTGRIFVAGHSHQTWGNPVREFMEFPSYFNTHAASFSNDGDLLWNTFFPTNTVYNMRSTVALDGSGNAFVTGGSNYSWGTPVNAHSGSLDAFVSKLDSNGNELWHTYLGSVWRDAGQGVRVDGAGRIYLAGTSESSWGEPVRAHSGGVDVFAVCLESDGSLLWNTFLGSGSNDQCYNAIQLDDLGNLYIAGSSDTEWGEPILGFNGSRDIFLAGLSNEGSLLWNAFVGSSSHDENTCLALGHGGDIYITGWSDASWGTPVREFTAGDSNIMVAGLSFLNRISGVITSGGSPLAGVVMNGLPGDPVTDASGVYRGIVSHGWSGTVTPTLYGYAFTPGNRVYSDVTSDQVNQDYSATLLPTYTISGTVTWNGSPLAGVVLDGLPGNPTTTAEGFYTATVVYGWSGTVTPTLSGYTFTPETRSYSNVSADQTNQIFSAFIVTFTISGNIAAYGTPLAGVAISGLPGPPVTDASGDYSATVNYGWSGTATPTLGGYVFTPDHIDYANVTSNYLEQDYTAVSEFEIPSIEREALIALYNSTNGDSWTNNSGWKTPPLHTDGFAMPGTEGGWYGITVSDLHVTRIVLAWHKNVSGVLPAELGDLSYLEVLDFSFNNISGNIPPELGRLRNLTNLHLRVNAFSGNIPVELADLNDLQVLNLRNNQLTGGIPSELGNLSNLQDLVLNDNLFAGPIPAELGNLSNLLSLSLNNNQLTGGIPSELGNLTKVEWIYLNMNQLSGSIPSGFGNLINLRELLLHANQLSGDIPQELGSLVNLKELRMGQNRLSGEIPTGLGNLTNLEYFYIQRNMLSGSLPVSLVNLTSLRSANTDLGYNALYTDNSELIAFLNEKDPDWAATQTIAPESVAAAATSSTTANVTWDAISYTGNTGGYRLHVGTVPGGPYTFFGQTADKLVTSMPVTGLIPGTPYYFVVSTRTDPHGPQQNTVDSEYGEEAVTTTFQAYTVTFLAGAGGTLTGETTQTVDHGSDCSAVTAVPHTGFGFEGWLGDHTGMENPLTVTNVTKNMTIFANFAINQYTVTFVEGAGGTITGDKVQTVNHGGSTSEVEALANAGCAFTGWSGDYTGTANPLTLNNITFNMTVTANFIVTVPATEREGLIALYNSTNGDSWTNKSGWKTPPLHTDGFAMPGTESGWYGIVVESNRVIGIWLSNNNLVGTIPAEIGGLADLKDLRLDQNQLSGSIPSEIGDLNSLRHLELSFNQLSGGIPIELCGLTGLEYLSLHGNTLSGNIPSEIGNMSGLVHIHLQANQLTGPIPVEIGDLANLQTLSLNSNHLTGEIPVEIGQLANLQGLGLYLNQLSGEIPAELGNLTNLTNMALDYNQLTGPIPEEIGNLTGLVWLGLGFNNLTGRIPNSLTSLVDLGSEENTWLDIGYNALYADDADLIAFLNDKDPDWAATQTIAPDNVAAAATSSTTVNVTWDSIPYQNNDGGYRVHVGMAAGGPYAFFGQTADKAVTSMPVTGLIAGTPYYFVVSTRTDPHGPQQNTVDSEYSEVAMTATLQSYTVTFIEGAGGTITGDKVQTVNHGGSTTAVTAVPDAGRTFAGWTGDYTGSANPLTLTNVTSNMTVTANFVLKTYKITATAGSGGTIIPSGEVIVNHGSDQGFGISANSGYHINDVLVDGVSVGAVGTYSFTNVTADHTIAASFTAVVFSISGTVTFEGNALAGVMLGGLPDAPTTNASGQYTATVTQGWSGNATPTLDGYTFTPASRTYTDVSSDQTAQNYTAEATLTPPLIPASITYPTSSTGSYTVSWAASTAATSYRLERSADGGGTWEEIYTGAEVSYGETVGNGSYRYRVRASNTAGTSDWRTGGHDCAVTIPMRNSPSEQQIVPEAIWSPASGGGTWVTEIQITSFSSNTNVQVYFDCQSGMRGPITLTTGLGQNQAAVFTNILSTLQTLEGGAFTYYGKVGALRFQCQSAENRIHVQARTRNGGYGKTTQGLRLTASNVVQYSPTLQRGVIQGLTSDATFRTFVGFYNSSADAITIEFSVINPTNQTVGSAFSKTIPAWGFVSFNPFDEAGRAYPAYSYTDCWLWINPTAGAGKAMGFGSLANNYSNDSYELVMVQFQ